MNESNSVDRQEENVLVGVGALYKSFLCNLWDQESLGCRL